MFNTQEFRQMLTETLDSAVSFRNLSGYDNAIIDELQKIAVSNKSAGDIEASAEPKEVRSARTIAETAAAIASAVGKRYIDRKDIHLALEQLHCTVWPFCREEPQSDNRNGTISTE
jgi:histone H3/H4